MGKAKGKEHELRRPRLVGLSVDHEIEVASSGDGPTPQPGKLQRLGIKIARWWRYQFIPKHDLLKPTRNKGIFTLPPATEGPTTVAVLGDWGSGNDSARRVADAVEWLAPDCTLHLGDIYYVGSPEEVERNCCGMGKDGLRWPPADGAFAVPGNHEYMSGGHGFFTKFLPTLGLKSETAPTHGVQETSYFCVDVGVWRFIGLDTGRRSVHYAGTELFIALLRHIPGVNRWKTWLPNQIVTWLRDDVGLAQADNGARGLVFLSHHQVFTALDSRGDFPRPAQQVAKLIDRRRDVVWLWGHEHRFAAYGPKEVDGGEDRQLTIWGRAVGNAGDEDPEVVTVTDRIERRVERKGLMYADNRATETGVGFNGFAILTIEDRTMRIDYYAVTVDDDKARVVVSEGFTLNAQGNVVRAGIDALRAGSGFINRSDEGSRSTPGAGSEPT